MGVKVNKPVAHVSITTCVSTRQSVRAFQSSFKNKKGEKEKKKKQLPLPEGSVKIKISYVIYFINFE